MFDFVCKAKEKNNKNNYPLMGDDKTDTAPLLDTSTLLF